MMVMSSDGLSKCHFWHNLIKTIALLALLSLLSDKLNYLLCDGQRSQLFS